MPCRLAWLVDCAEALEGSERRLKLKLDALGLARVPLCSACLGTVCCWNGLLWTVLWTGSPHRQHSTAQPDSALLMLSQLCKLLLSCTRVHQQTARCSTTVLKYWQPETKPRISTARIICRQTPRQQILSQCHSQAARRQPLHQRSHVVITQQPRVCNRSN